MRCGCLVVAQLDGDPRCSRTPLIDSGSCRPVPWKLLRAGAKPSTCSSYFVPAQDGIGGTVSRKFVPFGIIESGWWSTVDNKGAAEVHRSSSLAASLQLTTRTSFHPVRRRPTRWWSWRGSGRQGGARHCTNDLGALGRVCSALPGSTVDGMEAHPARHDVPAAGSGAPSIPVPADPPPEASSLTVAGSVECSPHATGLSMCGRASAQPGRSEPKAGAAPRAEPVSPPAERSAAGCLDEVEKVLSRCDELLAVVAPHVRAVAVQGVQEADRVDLGHALADLVGCEPGDGCRLA